MEQQKKEGLGLVKAGQDYEKAETEEDFEGEDVKEIGRSTGM